MKERFYKTNRGFSLIEIIFALGVLVVGIVGVMALFPVGLKASKRSGDFTVVTFLAQERLEQIKIEQDYYTDSNPPLNGWDGGTYSYPGYPNTEEFIAANGFLNESPGYFWAAVIAPVSATNFNLCQASVSIYYLDKGIQREENFVTYLVNYQ